MSDSHATPVVSVQNLTKRYGRTVAVQHLSFDVFAGEIFGFLGLNGAGKTTTIRILLDLLRPTAGRASVFGRDCQANGLDVRARVGYLPGEIGFYQDMTGARVLDLLDRLASTRASTAYQQGLLDRFELSRADLNRRLREYSTGMKRKLGIVQAFQSDPELLILDEPTEGLDPLMQEAFYGLLEEVRDRGRTVFMSSHVLSEVERVCNRVAVLRSGELATLAPVEDLRHRAPRRVHVVFAADVEPPDASLRAQGFTAVASERRRWTLSATGALGPLVARLSSLPVVDVRIDEPRLEDVVIDYYRKAAP